MDCEEPFDLYGSYRKAKDAFGEAMLFSAEDWKEVDRLFSVLGDGDREAQEDLLKQCEERFESCLLTLREKSRRNGKPALVLGGCVGAVLVLMFM